MGRKSYLQYCGVARALDVVGERWSLLIVRNLLLGPRRYSDLRAELPGITTNLLAKRLRELEALGLVLKEQRPPPMGLTAYRLSDSGRALEPVILELGRWGGRFMGSVAKGDTVNLGWAFLSLKRRYRGGVTGTVSVRAGERSFTLDFADGYLGVAEPGRERADLTLTGDVAPVVALFFQGASRARLEASGQLRVEGDRALLRALERAFGPPDFEIGVGQPRAMTRRKLSSKKSSVSSKRVV